MREGPGSEPSNPWNGTTRRCPAGAIGAIVNGRRRRAHPRASPRRLLDQAREVLGGGDGRKALELIRQARDRDDSLTGLPVVSFCASIQRARQLAAKGMEKEAAVTRVRADRYRAAISVPALGEDDWVLFVRYLDGDDALAAYAEHLTAGPVMLRVERALADRLVVERCWGALEALDESHPLRRDAGAVRSGLGAMDAGDWAQAASLLRGGPQAVAVRGMASVLQGHGLFRRP